MSISIGTPASSLLPGMVPPAPPTADQAAPAPQANSGTGSDADMNTNPTPPIGGASLGDMLRSKGQSLPTVSSPSLQKLNDGLNAAAQQKAASGTPSRPGDWARSLVAGAQSMLGPADQQSGAQSTASNAAGAINRIGASLGDAANVGTVPRGGGALTGITRTLGARNERLSQEKTNDAIHAETQMRTLQLVRNMYRQDQEDRQASYKQGADFMASLEADRDVEKNISQDELTRRIKADPNYMHEYIIKPIGEEQLFDADGKPLLADGHAQYSPLYGVAPIKSNSNEPSVHTITADDSAYLERNGGPKLPAGTVLDLARWNNAYTKAHANQDVQNAIKKANDDEASEESQRQMTDLMKNDPSLQHYAMMVPGHPITGLQQAAQNGQAHLVAITDQINALQQSKDPAAPQKIAQLQQQSQQFKDENDKIGKALQFGFTEAAKKDELAWQDKQKEDAETERHNKAAEANKAAEVKQKGDEAAGKDADIDVVAYDPNYQNADGSKGANVVTTRAEAKQNKLTLPHKVDPNNVSSLVAQFNDVQSKINSLADVVNNPAVMGKVDAKLAGSMLKSGHGIEIGAGVGGVGFKIDTSGINAVLYANQLAQANSETRAYVTAMTAAHEAITQLPRLQTYGKSSRMTQQQMEAAQQMLPLPGVDPDMAQRQMMSLQTTLDPLRKGMPRMEGAELTPTWLEKQGKTSQNDQVPGRVPNGADLVKDWRGRIIGYKQNGQQVLFGQTAQPAKQNPFSTTPQPTVKMISPDGKQTMNVPQDQVAHYKSRGAKQVYRVGDPITQNGQQFKVTSVDAKGNVTGAR